MRARLAGAAGAIASALRAGLVAIALTALIGALAGLAWGLSDERTYSAEATVLAVDRGEAAEAAGGGVVGLGGREQRQRLLALAESDDVADVAGASLGNDLSGVDLLARTDFSVGGDGTVVVRSTADSPDLAAAAANAFAGALVETATVLERRRLRSASAGIEERLAGLDPLSARAERLTERLAAIDELLELGPPLRAGAPAELPTEPEPGRSPALATLLGALAGAALAALALLARELVRRPVRRAAQFERAGAPPVVAEIGPGPVSLAAPAPATLTIDEVGADRAHALLTSIGIGGPESPGAIAVCSPMPRDGRTSLALALAAAAAGRGMSVLLVEADMRSPVLGELLALEGGPGLSEYLDGEATPREVINPVSVVAPGNGDVRSSFVCVTAGTAHRAAPELLSGARFEGLADQLKRVYDLVLFDTPPALATADAALVAAPLDGVLLCARVGWTRVEELARSVDVLEDSRLLGGVLLGALHRSPGLRRIRRRSSE